MADYKIRREGGVYYLGSTVVVPSDYFAWKTYQDWMSAGGVPDPMDPLPPVPVPLQRIEALARLRGFGLDRLVIGVLSHDGETYPLTQEWITALNSQPAGATVLNTDGEAVVLNPGQANALRGALASRVAAAVARYAALVTLINSSPDPLAVDITTGWPA